MSESLMNCLICEFPIRQMPWTDYSGEVFCPQCGCAYQRQWGTDERPTPYCNSEPTLPLVREYYAATGASAGQGTYISSGQAGIRYPLEERRRYNAWIEENLAGLVERYPDVPWTEETRQRALAPTKP
jgi:hypothetical protein